ncbi:MAG: hypothetical protein JW726_17560 [Anaerolineales bacterium]|nr:hypothetical protein [Anaerolineales bacterium]
MLKFFVWLIAGAAIGGLATLIIRRRRSILLLNIIIGSVGIFAAGLFLLPVFHINTTGFSLPGLLVSLGGAIVLLAVVNFFVREHTVTKAVLKSQWDRVCKKIHCRWDKLTKEDVDQIDGKYDRFVDLLEKRYGITEKEAEKQIQGFLGAVTSKVS